MAAWHDRITWRAREQAERHDELKRQGWWPCGECGQLNRPAHQECIRLQGDPLVSGVDYKAHATREAAVVLDECVGAIDFTGLSRDVLLGLMAACWLQGANYGSHETLALIEADFQRVRAEL